MQLANLNINELQRKLKEQLDGKRFLLVLDDVWNENMISGLNFPRFLKNGVRGSKILATTRTHLVASTMAKTHYTLSGLPEKESPSLLLQVAMKEERELTRHNLQTIAREIGKKCSGVPLAIMTSGRLSVFLGNTEEDWLNFKNNDLSRLHQEGDIMPSLKLSYDFLLSHLK